MLGKISRPAIGKLPDPLLYGGERSANQDPITSPKNPIGIKISSPRGLKNCDLGAVGLGIVAALDKSGSKGNEISPKFIVGSLNFNRSDPISVAVSATTSVKIIGGLGMEEDLESYTSVTSRGPNKATFSRVVYFDRVREDGNSRGYDKIGFDKRCRNNLGVFYESPPRCTGDIPVIPTSDFLSSCYLCRKKLHGKDIYMYRGEKAFCSLECRYRQIEIDEYKEKCGSEVSRSVDMCCSPYSTGTGGQLFSTGITAA
ncbi:PREDICTED: uncharacterized protein LOC104609291 [Nelumbo nucifera]|uniref:FLZ-type domain-containing protein n=2 Tax=Nelumbo nucifera TaxID=4432 RepID=A0A823A1G4_NELNU|nr:PREDICTED: uncharacterized protein LOC104609291 [Nelumbo nucifera]DAD49149.1 TPA_asm: hypothetical protein HUJ06_019086 [Nelumbo nucifera]